MAFGLNSPQPPLTSGLLILHNDKPDIDSVKYQSDSLGYGWSTYQF